MRTVRAAAHVHSEWSYDATWPLTSLAKAFGRRGYDVILTTEHDRTFDASRWDAYRRACAEASTDRLLFVPGTEYEDADSIVHVPVWGDNMPFLGAGRPTLDLLQAARSEGGFSVFAHPSRRDAMSRYRPEWAPFLNAVEIWNRHYDGIAPYPPGRRFAEQEGLSPWVSVDFHTRRQFFPLAMLIEIDGPLTPPAVVAALRAGRFHPEVFRVPALRFTGGLLARAAQSAERVRRRLRGPVRRIEQRFMR